MRMTIAQMLDNGALEAELRRQLQSADRYEAQDIEYALQITKAMSKRLAKPYAGESGGFALNRATATKALAAIFGDEPITELIPMLSPYADIIGNGDLETELQNQIIRAGQCSNYDDQQRSARGLVKARFLKGVLAVTLAGKPSSSGTYPFIDMTSSDWIRDLAQTIEAISIADPWDKSLREILGDAYPHVLDEDPQAVQTDLGATQTKANANAPIPATKPGVILPNFMKAVASTIGGPDREVRGWAHRDLVSKKTD